MKLKLDHIAILSRHLETVEAALPPSFERYPSETFESEGTKEQYIELEGENDPFLLLFEAISAGPYKRALEKRGPGLHHFGYKTDDLDAAVETFAKLRLLLHPYSLKSAEQGTVWMCRPGVPFLIEIIKSESNQIPDTSSLKMEIPSQFDPIEWLPNLHLSPSADTKIHVRTKACQFSISL